MTQLNKILAANEGKRKIIHERTKTSKTVIQIEDELMTQLTDLVEQMSLETTNLDLSMLMRKYNKKVTNLICAAVQAVYKEGINYVSDFKTLTYITEEDLVIIKGQTQNFVEQFWRRYRNYILQRNSVITEHRLTFHAKSTLSASYIVTALAIVLATHMLNLATLAKDR
jgi:hypothetical protein